MANVNSPPIRPPREWLENKEISKDVQEFYFFMFQLWKRTGGGTDFIEKNIIDIGLLDQFRNSSQPQLNDIRAQIGSGDFLTSDETGFTVDSINLSVDMTES